MAELVKGYTGKQEGGVRQVGRPRPAEEEQQDSLQAAMKGPMDQPERNVGRGQPEEEHKQSVGLSLSREGDPGEAVGI